MTQGALKDKVIAVTGAFGALGRATSDVLQAKGAKVAMLDMSAAPVSGGDASRLSIGGVDTADVDAISRALEQAVAAVGRLNGLVNIAGGFVWQKIDAGSVSEWDRMYNINLRTAVAASSAAIPHLVKSRGSIVNVGAAAAGQAGAGMGAYAASKAGVERLTQALSEELKDQGVNVNAVLPSILDTPANRASMPEADHGRWVSTVDLAQVIAFLLSDDSAAVTGALIPVKGRV